MSHFTKKTFDYFKKAERNKKNKLWIEKNRSDFDENVFLPFSKLVTAVNAEFGSELNGIVINPKKITRPVRKNPDGGGGFVRSNVACYLAEKATSMFENNPGIYISVGHKPDDNVLGMGIYGISSRQLSLLRNGLVEDFDEVHAILSSRKLKSRFGGLSGETYKRFPKGFSEDSDAARYLQFKQFFLAQEFKQKDILAKNYQSTVLKGIEAGLPVIHWLRKTVGTYTKKSFSQF